VLAVAGVLLAGPALAATRGLPAGLETRATKDGLALADAQGRLLYRLDVDRYAKRRKDAAQLIAARCADVCDKLWRPVAPPVALASGDDWSALKRPDGTAQLAYKGDPLYVFAGKSLDEAAAEPIAPSYFSSYSAKPVELRDGVPVSTLYWHAALYQPPTPMADAPAGVALRWMKTAYVFAAGDRPLYQAQGGDCAGACHGLEPLAAPLAALPVGAWRPVEDKRGRRCWSYRGRLVYAAGDAAQEPTGQAWRRLELR
jgi:predicted lipoprotein with Yx(FWY)xxD motif